MIREIVTDPFFLSQKSEPATKQDQQVIQDLLDTIHAHADHCVGMAANMIGVRKTILVAQIGEPIRFSSTLSLLTIPSRVMKQRKAVCP